MAAAGGPLDEMFHRLQVSAQFFVIAFAESFQVDVHGVNVRENLVQNGQFRRAIGDQYIFHAAGVYQTGGIQDVFVADQWLVVGKGHANISVHFALLCQVCQLLR